MRALLIRHAASSGQAPEAPLTGEGHAQATRLAGWLLDHGAGPLFSSPYARAAQTIAPYAELTAQSVTMVEALRERRLASTPQDDWLDQIRLSFDDANHACAGGESMADVRNRATGALLQIERGGGFLPTFVTHGGVTSALFQPADPSFGFETWQALRNPDVFQVTLEDGAVTAFSRLEVRELQ